VFFLASLLTFCQWIRFRKKEFDEMNLNWIPLENPHFVEDPPEKKFKVRFLKSTL